MPSLDFTSYVLQDTTNVDRLSRYDMVYQWVSFIKLGATSELLHNKPTELPLSTDLKPRL